MTETEVEDSTSANFAKISFRLHTATHQAARAPGERVFRRGALEWMDSLRESDIHPATIGELEEIGFYDGTLVRPIAVTRCG